MPRSTEFSLGPIARCKLMTTLQLTTMIPTITLLFTTLAIITAALPLDPAKSNPVATLWTFPNETWIENLAVRANGNLLCTSLNRAAIYQVDPYKHIAETLRQFASTDGCLGIAETASDVFVVVTANVSLKTNTAWPGSAKIWRVDVRAWELVSFDVAQMGLCANAQLQGLPEPVSLIANLTDVVLPDGVATLPYDPSVVLVADAAKGVIWRINTTTGDYTMAIDDPTFKPTDAVPLGVNGIHILNSELYFTNLATNSVGKVAITPDVALLVRSRY
jgi:hypothetical protein